MTESPATWVVNRLKEPSTRMGLAAIGAIISAVLAHPPQSGAEWLTLIIGTIGGVAGVVTKARGSADAPVVACIEPGATPETAP